MRVTITARSELGMDFENWRSCLHWVTFKHNFRKACVGIADAGVLQFYSRKIPKDPEIYFIPHRETKKLPERFLSEMCSKIVYCENYWYKTRNWRPSIYKLPCCGCHVNLQLIKFATIIRSVLCVFVCLHGSNLNLMIKVFPCDVDF